MRRRWKMLGGVVLVALLTGGAWGAPPVVDHMALFPQGAEVSFVVPPGPFDVTLPGPFAPDSVRLEPAPGERFPPQPEVTVEPLPRWIPPALRPLADRVEAMKRRALAAEASRDALGKILEKLDLFLPEGPGALEQIRSLEHLRREYALRKGESDGEADEARRLADAWEQELARRIPPGDVVLRIRGTVSGTNPRRLVVWTDQASWTYRYRLELDTATGRIEGSLRASVRNVSGVDWNGGATLHTTQPSHFTTLPRVVPLVASVREKGQEDRIMFPPNALAPPPAPRMEAAPRAGAPRRQESVRDVAFAVEQLAVSGDGTPRELPLETFTLQSTVALVAVPSHQAEAWILAEVASVDRAFLAGSCEMVADGAPSGSTAMPDRGAGQPLSLAFGSSPLVRAERFSKVGSEGTAWLGGGHREDGYTITVSNGLPTRRVVRVLDRIPVSAHDAVAVEDLHLDPAPVKNEEGILTWELPVEPGGRVTLSASWRMTFPGDQELTLQDKR